MLKISPLSTIGLATIIALALLLWGKSCKINKLQTELEKCQQADKPKTIHDTTIVLVPEQVALAETLTTVKETKPTKPQVDSFISFQVIADSTDINKWKEAYYDLATSYNIEKEYVDTAIFLNGIAITKSRVKQNELQEQKTILDSIRQEIIYNTIYKTQQAKDRTQLFLGIEAFGNKNELIQAAGFNGLLKLKSNIGFEGGYYFNSQQQNFYKVGVKFLIRLKKP